MKITATGETALVLSAEGGGLELATEGPPISPYHFLAASLASCVFLVIESWARQAGRGVSDLGIDVGWVHDDEDRVASMELTIVWPGLEDERRSTRPAPRHLVSHPRDAPRGLGGHGGGRRPGERPDGWRSQMIAGTFDGTGRRGSRRTAAASSSPTSSVPASAG